METALTTTSNVQIIRQSFENFIKGNIPPIIDTCADDIIWGSYKNPDVPASGTFYGKEGVMEFFLELAKEVNYTNFEPREYITEGDNVVVLGHQTAIVKSTGNTFDHDFCFHIQMRNGKLQRFFAYVDTRDQSQAFRS